MGIIIDTDRIETTKQSTSLSGIRPCASLSLVLFHADITGAALVKFMSDILRETVFISYELRNDHK